MDRLDREFKQEELEINSEFKAAELILKRKELETKEKEQREKDERPDSNR